MQQAVVVVMGDAFKSFVLHTVLYLSALTVCERAMLVLRAGARIAVPAAERARPRHGFWSVFLSEAVTEVFGVDS